LVRYYSGCGYKEKAGELASLLLVPATGVISNQFLEDLERIWALRDVIPNH
jgi:hypothetical protein